MQFVAVDWSGNAARARDFIWTAVVRDDVLMELSNGRGREEIAAHLADLASQEPRTVIGLDFAFSMPAWFLREQGLSSAHELWDAAAADGEQWLSTSPAPFWGRKGTHPPDQHLRWRQQESDVPRTAGISPKSVFQIAGAGAVGTGTIRGLPLLAMLSRAGFSIWPFDRPGWPRVVEIYPRLLTGPVAKSDPTHRAAYIASDRWALTLGQRLQIEGSEDAFDAAISAFVMAEHGDELTALPETEDEVSNLEGRIWFPAKLAAHDWRPPSRTTAAKTPKPPKRVSAAPQASLEDTALQIALDAHRGVLDKAGKPYILHVLRVANRMQTQEERLVAMLHDVVEDSPTTLDDLRLAAFPVHVVEAVAALTKPEGADYTEYIERLKGNQLALRVKLADLEDNMDVTRIAAPTKWDLERLLKYRRAWEVLRMAASGDDRG